MASARLRFAARSLRSLPGFVCPVRARESMMDAPPEVSRMSPLTWKIGDVEITRIPEVAVSMALGEFFPDATPAALAPHRGWLEPHFLDAHGKFELSIHGLLVDTG